MPASFRGSFSIGLLAACTFQAASARAAPAAGDQRVQADAEFAEAKALMDAGQTSAACLKFARSQELDPRLGRLLNLAFCHEQEGKTASAWREYLEATTMAEQKGQAEREDFAREHASAVARKLAFVHFDIPHDTGTVQIDGVELDRERWSTPVPFDPGRHTVVLGAPGKKSRTATLTVAGAPGMQVLAFEPLEDEVSNPASPPPASSVAVEAPNAVRSAASLGPALGVGGLAVLGLAVGAGFGLDAMSKRSAADLHCPGRVCDDAGSQLVSQARTSALFSTTGFGVAGVGAIVATYLFLREPAASEATAWVTPTFDAHATGLGVQGRW